MHRKLGLFAFCVCLTSMSAIGQTLQAVVGVGTNLAGLCQDIQNGSTAPITASASGPACSWNDGSDFGSGSGAATAAYGVLQSNATVSETITSIATNTATQTGGEFIDTFTFPGLSTNGTLRATLSVSVADTLSGSGDVTISADVVLNGSSSQCQVFVLNGSCTTTLPVTPGTQVAIQGSFLATAGSGPASGSSTFRANSKKIFGARYAFVLVDSSGHKVPIVAASGTKYPTK